MGKEPIKKYWWHYRQCHCHNCSASHESAKSFQIGPQNPNISFLWRKKVSNDKTRKKRSIRFDNLLKSRCLVVVDVVVVVVVNNDVVVAIDAAAGFNDSQLLTTSNFISECNFYFSVISGISDEIKFCKKTSGRKKTSVWTLFCLHYETEPSGVTLLHNYAIVHF